jgi:hypothetical protein
MAAILSRSIPRPSRYLLRALVNLILRRSVALAASELGLALDRLAGVCIPADAANAPRTAAAPRGSALRR